MEVNRVGQVDRGRERFLWLFSEGFRNCSGAYNGGYPCIGSALDTQVCATNVTCPGMSQDDPLQLIRVYFDHSRWRLVEFHQFRPMFSNVRKPRRIRRRTARD